MALQLVVVATEQCQLHLVEVLQVLEEVLDQLVLKRVDATSTLRLEFPILM